MGRGMGRFAGAIAVMALLVSTIALVGLPVTTHAANPTVDLSLAALGYGDTTLTGPDATLDIFFPDVGGAPGDSMLDVVYSHSNLLNPTLSTISIYVNDTHIASSFLDERSVGQATDRIAIPADRLKPRGNRVSFRFALRFRDICDGDQSPARSAVVYRATTLHYGLPATAAPPLLSDFPGQFLAVTRPDAAVRPTGTPAVGVAPLSVPIGLSIPPDATAAERNGAGTIVALLGNQRGTLPIEPRFLPAAQVVAAAKNANILFVGRAAAVPPELLAGAPFAIKEGKWQRADGSAIPTDAGVLLMVAPPGDTRGRVFIVSGNDDRGVARASDALRAPDVARTFVGQAAVVSDVAVPPTPDATTLTLADLGLQSLTVIGLGQRDLRGNFLIGPVSGPATMSVDLAHSPILDPKRSAMTVFVNEQPVVSIALDGTNGDRRLVRFIVPPNLLRAGRNTLRLSYNLQTVETPCQAYPENSQTYATLYPDTSLSLAPPTADVANLSLDAYPVPFTTGTEPLTVIVPDLGDADAVTAALRLAYATGGAVPHAPQVHLLTAAEATPQTLGTASAIAMGFPGKNALLQPLADRLVFTDATGQIRLRADGAGVTDATGTPRASSVTLTGAGTGPVGLLQLLPAPWNSHALLLVVAGTNADTRLWAVDALVRSRFTAREAIITRDAQGLYTVGEGQPLPTATLPPPPATAVPTLLATGAAAVNGTPVAAAATAQQTAVSGQQVAGASITPTPGAKAEGRKVLGLSWIFVLGVLIATVFALGFMTVTLVLRVRRRHRW